MDLQATYDFDAPSSRVWDLMIDPVTVAACLPGCDALEPDGVDTYKAKLTLAVAAISGSYEGRVSIVDQRRPHSYRLVVDGRGKAGFIKGEAQIELAGENGQTRVTVTGRAQVGGLMARVGQRLLGSVSKTMMDRFFYCLQQKVK